MTFFLDPTRQQPPVTPAPRDFAGFGEVVGAAFEKDEITANRRLRHQSEEGKIYQGLHEALGDQSPVVPLEDMSPSDPRWYSDISGLQYRRQRTPLLDAIRKAAQADPGKYANLPQDEAAVRRQATEAMQAELRDADETLMMGGWGSGVAEFVGTAGSAALDEFNAPLLGLGPAAGARLTTVFAVEATLAAAGETASLPNQFDAAKRLGLPDPDPLTQVAIAAGAAGILGVGLSAAGRGLAYLGGRKRQVREAMAENGDPIDHEEGVNAAEAALVAGAPIPGADPVSDAGLDRVAQKIIGVESGGRAAAQNPNSSAFGPGQFIERTWLDLIERHRPDLKAGRSRAQLLVLRADAKLSREMTVLHTRDNRDALAAAGLPTDQGSLYLAHFLGLGGAKKALRADPDAPIVKVMSPDQIAGNSRVRFAGKTIGQWRVGDLRRWAEHKMGLTPDPGDAVGTRRGFTRPDQVTTGKGIRVNVTYEVVDADSLIPARAELQPRDRTTKASDEQIAKIAAELDPPRMMPAPEADRGAPVVGPDNIIESGNGRVQALMRAAEKHPDRYEAYVAAVGDQFEIPNGVRRPVLVARRTSEFADDAARRDFVVDANRSTTARMSASERAGSDADLISYEVLSLHEPAHGLQAPANRAFVSSVLERIPQAERNGLVGKGGALNAEGALRIREALFARAYDARDLLTSLTEDGGGDLRGVLNALADLAPVWAQLRAEITAGRIRPEMDITPQLMDAVRILGQARALARTEGMSVRGALDGILAQGDMFSGDVDPVTRGLMDVFYRGDRPRAAAEVTRTLRNYVEEARKIGVGGLFDAGNIGAGDVLDAAGRRKTERAAGDAGAGAGDGTARQAAEGSEDAIDGPQADRGVEIAGADDAAWRDGSQSPAARLSDDQSEAELRDAFSLDRALDRGTDEAASSRTASQLSAEQPFESFDELYDLAPSAQAQLGSLGRKIADELGVEFEDPGIKARDTTEAKVARKGYNRITRLTDVVRGGFVVDTAAQADDIIARLRANGLEVLDEGWFVQLDSGYMDRKALVRMENGLLAEVQLWERALLKAKKSGGHVLYIQARASSDPEEIARLNAEMTKLYSAALDAADPSIRAAWGSSKSPNSSLNTLRNAASSASNPPVWPTSRRSTSTQSPPGSSRASATSPTTTAGRQSQLTNETMGTSRDVVGDTGNMGAQRGEVNPPGSAELTDARAAAALADFEIEIDGQKIAASEHLRSLSDDAEFIEQVNLCMPGGRRG